MPTEREEPIVKENETGLQPDPLMKEGRAGSAWVWTIGVVVLAAIVITFFAVGYDRNPTPVAGNAQHASQFTTGASNKPPQSNPPAGRTGSHAPKEGDYHTVR